MVKSVMTPLAVPDVAPARKPARVNSTPASTPTAAGPCRCIAVMPPALSPVNVTLYVSVPVFSLMATNAVPLAPAGAPACAASVAYP